MRLIGEMRAEEAYQLHVQGYKEDLKEITSSKTIGETPFLKFFVQCILIINLQMSPFYFLLKY